MNESNKSLFKVPKVKIVRGRVGYILDKAKDKSVLHLGCVDESLTRERIKSGELLHIKLQKVAKELYGVDISEGGIHLLQNLGINRLFTANVETMQGCESLRNENFDIIIAAEILEHLDNPGLFLEAIKPFFGQNTHMILSTVNAFGISRLAYLLRGYEKVHHDHNYWFSWKTLSSLVEKHNYDIHEIRVYSFSHWNLIDYFKKLKNKLPSTKNLSIFTIISFLLKFLVGIICIPVLGLLYTLNPFFGDGLIITMSPKQKT